MMAQAQGVADAVKDATGMNQRSSIVSLYLRKKKHMRSTS